MFITGIYRPAAILDADRVVLDGVKRANDEAVLDYVFADPRVDRGAYFHAVVAYSDEDDTAVVRLYKD